MPCPSIQKHTTQERLKLADFHESALGEVVHSKRGTSIEPLIEHIKSVFRINQLPVRGYDKVCAIDSVSIAPSDACLLQLQD